MTLCPEEQGTQTLFVSTSKMPEEKWGPLLMEEDGVVSCQAFFLRIEMHEKLQGSHQKDRSQEGWAEQSGVEENIERTRLLSES